MKKQIFAIILCQKEGRMDDNNPLLTWDELCQMEGEPVWVEQKYSFSKEWYGQWEVISSIWNDEYSDEPDSCIYMTDDEVRYKNDFGTEWKAYRKRKNE